MGLGHLAELMEEFVAHGADAEMPAAIIDNGTRPNQRVVTGTIETLAEQAAKARLHGPAIIIIGTVVTLRESWCTASNRRRCVDAKSPQLDIKPPV